MPELTKEELLTLITLFNNAQVKVAEAELAIKLLAKLNKMFEEVSIAK